MELLSIIVPVFNEAATVGAVIERLLDIDLPVPREVVVVDDASTDGTGDVLRRLPVQPDVLTIVHAERNAGKGGAVRIGLARARGTIVAIQDADLELDPAQLAALVVPIVEHRAPVVYGSRFLSGFANVPFMTVAGNRVLTQATNLLYGSRLTDMETCYKVMRREVMLSLGLRANRFDIEPEITAKLLRAGHTILELPVRYDPRAKSEGKKLRWRDGVHALGMLVRLRFGAP
jgi:glycosyltransferase involved in cell wall biosynthesis